MEVPEPRIDQLLRTAIEQKRLIQFTYKNNPRIVEPHDYGVHKGQIKLFGYQVGGRSSEPLPNWRWSLVTSIADLRLLNQTFPGRRPTTSGKHHQWDQIFVRAFECNPRKRSLSRGPMRQQFVELDNSSDAEPHSEPMPRSVLVTSEKQCTATNEEGGVLVLRNG